MKENTHIVLKNKDCLKYLSKDDRIKLLEIQDKIINGRKKDGKNPINNYYICNVDESYSKEVLNIILNNIES